MCFLFWVCFVFDAGVPRRSSEPIDVFLCGIVFSTYSFYTRFFGFFTEYVINLAEIVVVVFMLFLCCGGNFCQFLIYSLGSLIVISRNFKALIYSFLIGTPRKHAIFYGYLPLFSGFDYFSIYFSLSLQFSLFLDFLPTLLRIIASFFRWIPSLLLPPLYYAKCILLFIIGLSSLFDAYLSLLAFCACYYRTFLFLIYPLHCRFLYLGIYGIVYMIFPLSFFLF